MKQSGITLLAAVCLALSSYAADEGVHLFILSGQSNMSGLNPAVSFTPAVEQAFGKDRTIVVKDAASGQAIRRWVKGWNSSDGDALGSTADLYDRLMAKVKSATEGQTLASVSFVWMQGERDAKEKHGEVYEESFKTLITQLSADLKHENVNYVIGRISDFDMKDAKYTHWTMVRDIHVKLAEDSPNGAWVDTDDLNNKSGKTGKTRNDLHYTKEGYKELGQRFADAAIELIK